MLHGGWQGLILATGQRTLWAESRAHDLLSGLHDAHYLLRYPGFLIMQHLLAGGASKVAQTDLHDQNLR